MKKNFFRMFAAILFCGAIATVFTACSKDDDDNNNNNQPTPEAQKNIAKTASAWFEVIMGQDVLEVFDVEVTTISPSIGESTKKLTKSSFSFADRECSVKDPGSLVFAMSVKVTPKAGFTPDASKTYNLGLDSDFAYLVVNEKNEPLVGHQGVGPVAFSAMNVPGDKLADRIERFAESWSLALQKVEVYKTYYVLNGTRVDF